VKKPTIAVVGAGAAGIIAAWRAATLGAAVTLYEKTPRVGTKIMISGGGKCNLTHDGPTEDVLRAFRPNEAQFLRPSLYRFGAEDFLEILTSRGLAIYTRPDGRIFPVYQNAKDVVQILIGLLREVGVTVRLEEPVTGLDAGGVRLRGRVEPADSVIVATGGSSYPNSGTTGDGWRWIAELGHSIVPLRAALAPIYLHQNDIPGLALRDVLLKARTTKEIAKWRGDLLFTHQGISGPSALGVSRDVAEAMESAEVTLSIDSRPDETFESLSERLIRASRDNPHHLVASRLDLPERFRERVLTSAAIPLDQRMKALERKARNRLIENIKGLPLGRVRAVPLEKGEVVAGGVSLAEVDAKTMRSRIVPNLILCGEVLDIAGPVGGYNLQAAWSTGYVAGNTAALQSVE